jgi:hypothetical protein
VKNEAVLIRFKQGRNGLQIKKRRKAGWINHILLRNCLLKYVIRGNKGRIKVMGRRRRRSKQ